MESKTKRGRPSGTNHIWDKKKTVQLKKLYPVTDNDEIASIMGITVRTLRSRAQVLGLKKTGRYWSAIDCKWLLDHYGALGYNLTKIMAHFPEKSKWGIINKYRELAGKR